MLRVLMLHGIDVEVDRTDVALLQLASTQAVQLASTQAVPGTACGAPSVM
jgi:hypothetical protein